MVWLSKKNVILQANFMGKRIVITSVLLFFILGVNAQTLETGLFAGASYYLGDINPGKHFDQSLFAAGAIARYNQDNRWAFRLSFLLGQVQAADELRKVVENRELAFTSRITEFSGVIEFNFFPYETGSDENYYTPYIFAGVGVFFFQPQIAGYKLRDYGTEGQNIGFDGRSPYALRGLSIPFGIGFKYSLTKKIGVSIEWGMRKTFTDYIDDISTTYYLDASTYVDPDTYVLFSDPTLSHQPNMERGNPETKDWFNFYGIALTYKFNVGKIICDNF
jgi:hypothetical protein